MGIAQDIDQLESKIARLKVEYEQYFMRLVKREPAKLRDEVDRLILQYSTKKITNTSVKFRYNSITAKYSSYKQYWSRVLRAIEEGTYQREAAQSQPSGGPATVPAATAQPSASTASAGANADLAEIYKKYLEAKAACNEPTGAVSYDNFVKSVEQTRQRVKEVYKTSEVDLKVTIKDGKAKISIMPKSK